VTALPSNSKSSRALSVNCLSVSSPAACSALSTLWMTCRGAIVSPICPPPISAFDLAAAKALSNSVAMSRVFICRAFAAPLLICDVGHQRLCGHEGGKDGERQKHDVHRSYCLNDAGAAQSKPLDGLSLAISCQRLARCGHGQARPITITSAVPTLRAGRRPDLVATRIV